MIHPSTLAEDFIFDKFCETFLSEPALALNRELLPLLSRVNHKPIVKSSAATASHFEKTLEAIHRFEQTHRSALHAKVDFSLEKRKVARMLRRNDDDDDDD